MAEYTSLPRRGLRACAALAGFCCFAAPLHAITCRDGSQLVQGNYIVTPYCQDALVAQVARQYGVRVAAVSIRENPHVKRDVCRIIGHDIRVQQTCIDVGRGVRRGFW